MKRCLSIICTFLVILAAFSAAWAEPLPQDTLLRPEEMEFDMLAVDHRLYELGYRDAECNGELDEVTINALKKFQVVNGLEVTGDADRRTVELLLSEEAVSQIEYLSRQAYEYANAASLEKGAYGEQVLKLQRALQKYGYFSGKCDGAYGDATAAAVCRFQMANGLQETGIADGAVFMRLYNGEPITWDGFIKMNCAAVGDTGENVRLIQLCLQQLGRYGGECTGKYGEGTQQAVRDFQMENGLEASGDVDEATVRKLFSAVGALVSGGNVLSRGSSDERIEAICLRLNELGYGAHSAFDLQTELALMKYQYVNGMTVSGTADESLIEHINGENAAALDSLEYAEASAGAEMLSAFSKKANAMLGQMTQLDEKWNFVEYLFLSCGYPLPDTENMHFIELDADEDAANGSVLKVMLDDQEIYGIAATDGAMIYQGDEGYVIISYLDMMEAERIYIAGTEEENAA